MSDERDQRRRAPGAFDLPGTATGQAERRAESDPASGETRLPRSFAAIDRIALDPEDAIDADRRNDDEPEIETRRGFSFGKLLLGSLSVLFSLAIGLAVDAVVRDLFQRNEWLGWTALALAGVALVAAFGIVIRETIGVMRLGAVDRERQRTLAAYRADSLPEARLAVSTLETLLSDRPETARGRAEIASLKDEVIDGADLIALAETHMLGPLDLKARALVLASAKRVSVVTAVSPKAIVDVAYVVFENIKLIRKMSELYGARPGALGLVKLTRDVLAHLAVTGSIAVGDSLVQEVIGHGLAARLSQRLGEGIVNGLLTARVGLAAMDLCRPMPFLRAKRPRIGAILSELTASSGAETRRTP
ncbi:TIGR01620 family protein [Jiella sp. MQZ9-1]|uniref:TIGR01620 family protein n=1 Tax=Jiella flava TaxID=2816857 RepID=A0A939FY29_9HYPH|nr:TIGR01620 family protein [Jiella flava]MBO0662994.1 TIGR01620 family protein [Jiella flava]MCD2471247.1 TIGR01620 family protein [Jiella flava]